MTGLGDRDTLASLDNNTLYLAIIVNNGNNTDSRGIGKNNQKRIPEADST